MAGKWLELLTEIAPGVKRVAVMFDPDRALTDQGALSAGSADQEGPSRVTIRDGKVDIALTTRP
jgi:hypothetical protein